MALLVAVAGGLIGSIFGLGQLGFLAGSLIGSLLFNKPQRGGPKLKDLSVTASTYGQAIQIGFGTARVGGNIIWSYPLKQHKHGGPFGKGLGGGATYTYSWTGAVALCSTEFTGPIQKVLKIWADTKLVYDATGQSGITKNIPGSGGGKGGGHHGSGQPVINGNVTNAFNKLGHFRVYQGSQTQVADPALETLVGAANAQAHRGMAYVVFEDIDLTNYGNRVPNWTFEVVFSSDSGPNYSQNAFQFTFNTATVNYPGGNNAALDQFRQRAYFMDEGPGNSTTAGLHSESLATGHSVLTSTMARTTGNNASRFLVENGMIVADDGYLWCWSQEANYGPWIKIDPDTLLEVGHIGTASPFMSVAGSTTIPNWVVPLKLGYANCLFVAGTVFQDLHLLDLDNETSLVSTTYTSNVMRVCGGNQVNNNQADVFGLNTVGAFAGGSTTPFTLYHFLVDGTQGAAAITQTVITTINPSDIDSEWTHFDAVSYFVFDATDGNVMFFVRSPDSVTLGHSKQYLVKYNTQTGSLMWKLDFSHTPGSSENLPGNPDYGSYQTMITNGIMSFVDTFDTVWSVSTQDGSATKNLWPHITSTNPFIWNDALGAILFNGDYNTGGSGGFSGKWGVLVTNAAGSSISLSTIVTEICEMVGFQPTDLDVSELTDEVNGYLITNQMTGQDALRPLALAFLFDGVESDNIIKFIKRGGSSLATIPSTDLGYLDSKMNMIINEVRVQEVDLPRQIALNFLDPNHNYQTGTQYARRPSVPFPTMYSQNFHTEDLPLVAEPNFMKQLAEKILFTTWIERVSFKVHLPWTYLKYDPTDVLTLTNSDASTTLVRMSNVSLGQDLTMEWQAIAQSTTTYASTATTDGGLGFNQQTLTVNSPTKLFLLDMPLLRDTDDTGQSFTILYDASAGYGPDTWNGSAVSNSLDDTVFNQIQQFVGSQQVAWGTATNALGDTANPFTPDNVNTLTVQMITDSSHLSSATLLAVCNGANAAALYNVSTGVIEILQFQTVTTNADGTFTLSGLLRGRRGTEVFTGAHVAGELFVLLETSTMQAIKMNLGDLNTNRFYKDTTAGELTEDSDTIQFTDTGNTFRPYAPVQVAAVHDGSGGANLSWVRRTRVGGELMPYTGIVPLSEQSEIYEVDIYNGSSVVRTLRVEFGATPTTSPGVNYPAADVTADFGSLPATLTLAVYQISTVIGRGFAKKVTVTVT